LGLEAIPREHAARLTDQGTWGLEELVALACECYDIKMQQAGF
ncbi:MAG: ADP-ribosylglycohydrolase family protein, partial [Deferribacteres bacterium]|nr:ADP-ribosylglycohydrolase family protein [Deferribacteres bacterium]